MLKKNIANFYFRGYENKKIFLILISETPLTLATTLKKPSKVIIALVNGGALLDYRTKEGLTAMHRAVERNSLEAVKTLLELGASPNYKDTKGLTPLYYSVIHKTDPMLCETLLHDHATIGAQDLQGWQEVHQVLVYFCLTNFLCYRYNEKLVRIYKNHVANIFTKQSLDKKKTCLHFLIF